MMTTCDKIAVFNEYMELVINNIALKHDYHLRIVVDKGESFGRPKTGLFGEPLLHLKNNYEWARNNAMIEVSHDKWEKGKGWGQPDKIVGGLEFRFLWKDNYIMSLEQYLKNK